MKTIERTVFERIGENMGKIADSGFDFSASNCYQNDPEYKQKKISLILEIEKLFHEGKKLKVMYDPIIGGELVDVGMWDGWPYWSPTPAVCLSSWHGSEWHFWQDIQSYSIIEASK